MFDSAFPRYLRALTSRLRGPRPVQRPARRRPGRPPAVEWLEDRTVPAVYRVTGTADGLGVVTPSGTPGVDFDVTTLRGAVLAANTTVGVADTIKLPPGTCRLTLTGSEENAARTGDLDITGDLTILGAVSAPSTIDASSLNDRVFDIFGGTSTAHTSVSIQGLTITGGKVVKVNDNLGDYGGALRVNFYADVTLTGDVFSNNSAPHTAPGLVYGLGGAISNDGNLTITNCQFANNSASNSGGAIYVGGSGAVTNISNTTFTGNVSRTGGAISNGVQMLIKNSTFTGNQAGLPTDSVGQGGAISNNGSLTAVNSTFSGNTSCFGGAIANYNVLGLEFTTIAGNSARYGGGVETAFEGADDYLNTIIAGNTAATQGPDVYGAVQSMGHNLVGNTTNSSGWVASDLLNVDPKLGPLANNGGPTQTRALLAGSPAIDAAASSALYTTDQRGVSRPQGPAFDIGAFEAQVSLAPVARDDSYVATKDTVLTVAAPGVLGNDSDPNGNPLTALLVSGPSHGNVALNSSGAFSYAPAPGYTGPDTFTYKANDGQFDSNVATVTITVRAPDRAPVAAADSYTASKNNALTVAAPGVLGNDSDPDGDPLTAILVSGPGHGSLTLNANGSFTYTPASGYTGSDSFTYKANDGQLDSNVATVSVSVNDDAPVARNDSFSASKNSTLTIQVPGVLANDTDANRDPLTAVLVSGPSHGTLALNANGSFSYTPATGYTGADSFTYKANDGQLNSNVATVSLAVNDRAPVATNDSYSTNENTQLPVAPPGVLANDGDPDGDPITAVLVSGPSHGTLALNSDGSLAYTPAANYYGPDQFTYRASDGQLTSNLATVSITVNHVNQAPVAENDTYSTPEDTPLVVTLPTGQGVTSLTMTSDPGDWVGQGRTYSFSPSNATFTVFGGASGVQFNVSNATDFWTLFLDPPTGQTFVAGQYPNALRFPDATHPGLDVSGDGRGSNQVFGQFTVLQAQFDATGKAQRFAADFEQHSESASAPALRGSIRYNYLANGGQGGVLANDHDVDGDPLTAILVSGPSHGTLTLNPNGTFSYTPAPNFNGIDTFTYKANDGQLNSNVATVTITVTPVNDAPVAANDSYAVSKNNALTVAAPGVLANDTDVDGDPLKAILVTNAAHGSVALNADGSFTYTPTAGYTGGDSFTYKANDGQLDSNVATVSLTVSDDAPVAANDSYAVSRNNALTVAAPGVLANDTDANGDALTAVLVANAAHGSVTLNADGSFTYTPTAGYTGADSFSYKANDGQLDSNVATVAFTITDDAPVANADSYGVSKNNSLTVAGPGVLGNDTDANGDALTAVLVAGPAHGSVALSANGSFTYTPASGYTGSDSFTYKANDGQLDSNVATVSLTVSDDAPVANNDGYAVSKNNALTVAAPGVLANDTDANGDVLTAVLVSGPAHGSVALNANGSFTYTPASGYTGGDSFTYKANDGQLDSNVVTVALAVSNDAPVANNDGYAVSKNNALTVAAPGVLANDTDANGDVLTAALVTNAAHGSVALNADGSFTYTPASGYTGSDSFTYKANDGQLDSNVATVSFVVSDDAPVATADSYSVSKNNALTISPPGVLGNDTDANGDPLKAILVANAAHGSVLLNSDGSFRYTPTAGYTGADSFSYKANDGQFDSNVATVSLTVSDDAPVATADSYSVSKNNPLTVSASGVLANDTDANGDVLTAALVTNAAHGSVALSANGSFTYTPASGYTGSDSFTYKANDGQLDSNVATVTFVVSDDAPVATADSYSVSKNNPLTVSASGVLANDTDANGDVLTAVLVTNAAHGSVTLNANGSFTYTPAAGYTGSDSFTYKANDGQLDSNVATVTLNAHNDAPVAANDSYSTTQGSTLTVTAPGVLANDADPNHDPLTAILVSGPANGTLQLKPDGSFTYTPNLTFAGTDTFTYRASDGRALSGIATVTITVPSVNTPGVTIQTDPEDPNGLALVVRGTSEEDNIDIKSTGDANRIQVTIRSDDFHFSNTYPTTFTRIIVYGLAGDDDITVANSVKLPALLFGGSGDDHIQAGGGPTVLVGDNGDDHLQGGQAPCVLIGGRGSDQLQAGGDGSILIAGYTDLDTNARALCAVLDEWASSHTYVARATNLGSVLNSATVHDDGAEDHVIGGTGTDWFLVNKKRDKVNGARAGEIVTDTSGW